MEKKNSLQGSLSAFTVKLKYTIKIFVYLFC